jgi:DNA-directed RNA polymerase specialized sigma24 family protein
MSRAAPDLPVGLAGVGSFQTTRWTVIMAAKEPQSAQGQEALARFCQAYWYPVYCFIRGRGCPHHDAQDLTQDYFAWLLEKEVLGSVTREGGKFRSFLLTVLCRFLSSQARNRRAQKRGGGQALIPIDPAADTRYQAGAVDGVTPETLFHQQWALAVLDQARQRVREEYAASDKHEVFAHLVGCLPGARQPVDYAGAATALGMKLEAVREAACRLRKRYGKAVRTEIAHLGCSPEETDEEIRFLMDVLGQ